MTLAPAIAAHVLVSAVAGPVPLAPLRRAVAEAYARLGEAPPPWDPALSRAAAAVAGDRATGLDPPELLQRRDQEAGLGDPAPAGFLVEGSDLDLVGRTLSARLPSLPGADAIGIGAIRAKSGLIRAVVLRARRRAWIEPPPRAIAPGGTVRLEGRLAEGLRRATIDVEGPDGRVTSLPIRTEGNAVQAKLELRAKGRYRMEIMVDGDGGPEVVWLRDVWAGSEPPSAVSSTASAAIEPADPRAGRQAVFESINRLRLGQGEPALAYDARLEAIAEAYAKELRDLHLLAHVSPRSGDLVTRLRRAGYRYARAGENLAQGPDVLQAQSLTAGSPGHRRNILDPSFDRCGIGIAKVIGPAGEHSVIVTELFAGG